MSEEIRKMINRVKKFNQFVNENTVNNLQNIISKIGERYSKEHNKSPQQLNSGDCEDIAYDVIEQIGGETPNTFIVDDGWFWDVDEISNYKTLSGEYWNVNNLKKYGNPYFGYDKLDKLDLNGHVWIYSDGKHYDVETINGVDNFWYLPIYQRQLAKLKLI